MQQLIKNLSPLIGCKVDSYKWCPSTAYQVCKSLRLASLVCLDLDKDKFYKSGIKYEFDNKISIKTYKIHKAVLEISPEIIDQSYIIQSQEYLTLAKNCKNSISLNDALFFYSINKTTNDSAIIDCIESLYQLKQSKLYKGLLLVLLDSYSLRYELYQHYFLGYDLDYGEIRQERIDRLINNVYYIKARLEDISPDYYLDINHHLASLLYNLCLIKNKLKDEYIEVGEL